MNFNIIYEPINEKHISAAADLVLSAYKEEKMKLPFLPDEQEFLSSFHKSIRNLFKKGSGIAAMYHDELVGFLAGFEIDELFGKCKGIYSPLYGHGVMEEYCSNLYKELYKHAAELWVKNSYMCHAITCYPQDKDTIDTWFWLGFGLRCVDAIRETTPIHNPNTDIIIKKAELADIPAMANLDQQLNEHLNQSPLFMPMENKDSIQYLTKWIEMENHHLWVAYHNEKPLGYMKIEPNAETFVSDHENVMNITGAYVLPNERKSGIGALLLNEIQEWLQQNGYPLCGVDFESFNIVGSSFWTKHFTPYTYSLVRRIDERIISD